MQNQRLKQQTLAWVKAVVVGLNLCPFAKRELDANKVSIEISYATTDAELLTDLQAQLEHLIKSPDIETALLIHPDVLTDFHQYNEFLSVADSLLEYLNLEGVIQIASFHPDYQFADTAADDAANYSNRSPYPMLHLLREGSVEKAIEHYPGVHDIPQRNIELLTRLGAAELKSLLNTCLAVND